MKQLINKIIKPKLDRVRYYPLCQNCLQGVEVTSGLELLHEAKVIIV